MKNLKDLIWITQLGLSILMPLALFIVCGVWLRDKFHWGNWVIFLAMLLGLYSAFSSFRVFAKLYTGKKAKPKDEPPVSFREHD